MLTMLAAIAVQTAALDADPAKAGLTCATVIALTDASGDALHITSQVSHVVMLAARANPGNTPFLERVGELTSQTGTAIPIESAKALAPQCLQRFPLAFSTATPRLPADPFSRDVMCFGILGILKGTAEQLEEDDGDAGPLDAIELALAPISDRLTDDVLKARGIQSQDGFTLAMSDQLKASLDIGNPSTIARACGVAWSKPGA